jgi:cytochrome oxidase assembly protein ShyY1
VNVGFFSVALKPKWIGALLLALAAAALFAGLGQWQLGRAFSSQPAPAPSASVGAPDAPKPLDALLAPGAQLLESSADELAIANLRLNTQHIYIVANRVQLVGDHTENGYWLIGDARTSQGAVITVALGWTPDLDKAESARLFMIQAADLAGGYVPVQGRIEPPEEPKPVDSAKPYLFKSISTAQLLNVYSPNKAVASYDAFLVVDEGLPTGGISRIVIGKAPDQAQVNLLNAFYAAEWTLFAGFAVFMWWRMVRDEVLLLRAEALEPPKVN